jgi:type I restriction enzyme, S subunit
MAQHSLVSLGDLITFVPAPHAVEPDKYYPIAGVYGFGRGMIRRAPTCGQEIAADQLFRIKSGQFIYSRLKSFEGAFAVVPDELDGYFVSNEFPTFDIRRDRLEPAFLGWYFKQPRVWQQLASDGRGIGARRERLHPHNLLGHTFALPLLETQRLIVGRLECAAAAIVRSRQAAEATRAELRQLLVSAFRRAIVGAPRIPMGEIAPIVRRPVELELDAVYAELGARSFGKGLFKKPDLISAELTWQKLFRIHHGDIVFSNIKAWEGAFAVAKPEHHGKVGSHRYLTCVVDTNRATPTFLWYFLQSSEGLAQVQAASPGSADRNRTLNQRKLAGIKIPLPSLDAQLWFDGLQQKARSVHVGQSEVAAELDYLTPALLHQAFG